MNAPAQTQRPVPQFAAVLPGDPAPWFHQRSTGNPRYAFDTAAGRYIVMCFFMTAGDPAGRDAIGAVMANRHRFDDVAACCFGVSADPRDEAEGRVRESLPGIRHFWDFDGTIGQLYGAVAKDAEPGQPTAARRFWLVLDPTMRIMAAFPLTTDGSTALFDYLGKLPPPDRFAGFEIQAPVLILPNVFETEFCRRLIGLYDTHGGEESGFMREVDGKTVAMTDHAHKRRKDYIIDNPELIKQTQARIRRRINSEMVKVHAFNPTRMERYIVSCYAAEDAGHFRAPVSYTHLTLPTKRIV